MARLFVPVLIVLGLLSACSPQTSEPPATGTGSMMSAGSSDVPLGGITEEDVVYATVDGKQIHGFLAMPVRNSQVPALVLIHEWWGLNDNIKDNARNFAKLGYAALAVDLYDGQGPTTDQATAQKLAGTVQNDMTGALLNLKQAVAYLKTRPNIDSTRLGTVGWCFGGGWSYQMAKNDLGVKSTVMYYGRFSAHDDFAHMRSSIIGHFGEKDMSIKTDDVKEFEAALKTLNGTHEVYIYPNAGHGFANPDNPGYDEAAAKTAWNRTVDFLSRTLKAK